MPTYRGLLALVVFGALLAGCTNREERVLFDGNYYPGKVRAERDDRRNFTASVGRAGRGIEGARKAVVHEATRYCIENFGTSTIEWDGAREGQAGPVHTRSGDRVSASGTCVIWR
nr:hypothetical protein [Roseovarius autotrophicus]